MDVGTSHTSRGTLVSPSGDSGVLGRKPSGRVDVPVSSRAVSQDFRRNRHRCIGSVSCSVAERRTPVPLDHADLDAGMTGPLARNRELVT